VIHFHRFLLWLEPDIVFDRGEVAVIDLVDRQFSEHFVIPVALIKLAKQEVVVQVECGPGNIDSWIANRFLTEGPESVSVSFGAVQRGALGTIYQRLEVRVDPSPPGPQKPGQSCENPRPLLRVEK
jgi:hypothetical protein